MLDSVISRKDRSRENVMGDVNVTISNVGNPMQVATQRAELSASQQQTVREDVNIARGLLENLKEDILDEVNVEVEDEKEKKRIQNDLKKAEKAFSALEKAAVEGNNELPSGVKSRLADFIDNLADENSRTNKAIKLVSKGAEKGRALALSYNTFAPWFTLPSIPPALLGDEKKKA